MFLHILTTSNDLTDVLEKYHIQENIDTNKYKIRNYDVSKLLINPQIDMEVIEEIIAYLAVGRRNNNLLVLKTNHEDDLIKLKTEVYPDKEIETTVLRLIECIQANCVKIDLCETDNKLHEYMQKARATPMKLGVVIQNLTDETLDDNKLKAHPTEIGKSFKHRKKLLGDKKTID